MNYLLDTCTYIWFLMEPEQFSPEVRYILEDGNNRLFVSSITGVEISIKTSIGKLRIDADHYQEVEARGLEHLPFRYQHSKLLETLPYHHRDPFDRMLIAQACCEQLTIITADQHFKNYPVLSLLAKS